MILNQDKSEETFFDAREEGSNEEVIYPYMKAIPTCSVYATGKRSKSLTFTGVITASN